MLNLVLHMVHKNNLTKEFNAGKNLLATEKRISERIKQISLQKLQEKYRISENTMYVQSSLMLEQSASFIYWK